MPHYFYKKITIFFSRNNEALHFSEELMKLLIFFWRNNEALDFLSAEITFAGRKGFRWKLFFCEWSKFWKCRWSDGSYSCFWKWWKVQLSVYVLFSVFANISSKNEAFVSKVGFKNFVEVMGFHMCLRMVNSAVVCGCLCFFVFVIVVSKLFEK